jgi:hypothetical protein
MMLKQLMLALASVIVIFEGQVLAQSNWLPPSISPPPVPSPPPKTAQEIECGQNSAALRDSGIEHEILIDSSMVHDLLEANDRPGACQFMANLIRGYGTVANFANRQVEICPMRFGYTQANADQQQKTYDGAVRFYHQTCGDADVPQYSAEEWNCVVERGLIVKELVGLYNNTIRPGNRPNCGPENWMLSEYNKLINGITVHDQACVAYPVAATPEQATEFRNALNSVEQTYRRVCP